MVQLSHLYMSYWKNRSFDYIDLCRQSAQKSLNDPDIHDGLIAHLEPDILECEVKWALGSVTMDSEVWEKVKILKSTLSGEGNGNPLQCSCLGNPRDRGAWWAAIYGV